MTHRCQNALPSPLPSVFHRFHRPCYRPCYRLPSPLLSGVSHPPTPLWRWKPPLSALGPPRGSPAAQDHHSQSNTEHLAGRDFARVSNRDLSTGWNSLGAHVHAVRSSSFPLSVDIRDIRTRALPRCIYVVVDSDHQSTSLLAVCTISIVFIEISAIAQPIIGRWECHGKICGHLTSLTGRISRLLCASGPLAKRGSMANCAGLSTKRPGEGGGGGRSWRPRNNRPAQSLQKIHAEKVGVTA